MTDHNAGKKYYEFIAKTVLEKYLPSEFFELEMPDIPDLRTKDGKGIEVTIANSQNDMEASFLFERVKGKSLEEADPKVIKKMKKLRQEILFYPGSDRIFGFSSIEDSVYNDEIRKSTLKKIEKIGNYKMDTDLFIFAPVMGFYDDNEISDYICWAKEKQKNNVKRYLTVFVFDYCSLYKCNIESESFERINIDRDDMDLIIHQALELYY